MVRSSTHGRICYVEIPATDIDESAAFYVSLFGWSTRRRGDGHLAFDDATGAVSGSWVTGRRPHEVGLLLYVMVDSVSDVLAAVVAAGGRIVQPIGADAPEVTARVLDPGGNVIGLYQEPAPDSAT